MQRTLAKLFPAKRCETIRMTRYQSSTNGFVVSPGRHFAKENKRYENNGNVGIIFLHVKLLNRYS